MRREFHHWLLGEAKKSIQRGGAGQRRSQCPEMQRQKNCEQKPRDSMRDERPPCWMTVRTGVPHHTKIAYTARSPITRSASAMMTAAIDAFLSRQRSHSTAIVLSPIGTWTAQATTNTE